MPCAFLLHAQLLISPSPPPACSGEKWKVTRNAWQPFFSRDNVSRHGKLMGDSADKLCSQLHAAAAEGRGVDIWREAGRMTLDVVGTTAFG